MIARLTGLPTFAGSHFILDVHGVGYRVSITSTLFQQLTQKVLTNPSEQLILFIHTWVKEDCLDLYGFLTEEELHMFRYLIQISGIGPKTALSVINQGVSSIVSAVQHGDVSFFSSVPRLGKKSAQKIIIELTPKLGSLNELNLRPLSGVKQDVFEALLALGYDERSVSDVVRNLEEEIVDVTQGLQIALRKIQSK